MSNVNISTHKKIKDLWLIQDENGLKSVSCRMQLLLSLITIFDQFEGHQRTCGPYLTPQILSDYYFDSETVSVKAFITNVLSTASVFRFVYCLFFAKQP